MIFDANTTSLGSSIPMAEGYDGTVGVAKALIESARNDYAMFRAMLNADARELSLRKSGYVAESEILALQEATSGSIWKKIADLFKKLIAKIKGIFSNFLAKFRGLYMQDKDLVKKYADQVMRKSNISNLEVKWRKLKSGNTFATLADIWDINASISDLENDVTKSSWKPDLEDRWKEVCGYDNASDYKEKLLEDYWEDDSPETYKISEIGGIRNLINEFDGGQKAINKLENSVKKVTSKLDTKVKEYNKKADDAAKAYTDADKNDKAAYDKAETDSTDANHAYDMAVVSNDVSLIQMNTSIEVIKEYYKQLKSAFMKAVTVNNDKLAESSIYAQAVAEAAEQEVEDVISGALDADGREMLASTSIADQDLNPGDGYELGYSPNKYSDDYVTPDEAGEKKSTIVGTEESSIFSSLLY